MEKQKKIGHLARLALFSAALIWGSSFVVMKNSVDIFPPHLLLTIRFSLGCVILAVLFHSRLKRLDKGYLIQGGILGILLIAAYTLQTIGLTGTTPGKNAFLTAVYCVLVPFVFWAVNHVRPDPYNIMAAFLCVAGIGLVSLDGSFVISWGDGFTLLGGIFYAIHIVAVSRFTQGKDPVLYTIVQFGAAAMVSFILSVLFEQPPVHITGSAVGGILYLAIFATALALLFQNIGQKYTHPATASILLSLEAVFGVFFSILLYHEKVTLKLMSGFGFILVAVILSETKLSFLRRNEETEILQE